MSARGAPRVGDAFGEMLLDCLAHDQPVVEVVERSDGRIDTGDARRYFAPSNDWRPEERDFLRRAAGRVLDIGAGAGRHAHELQSQGREVVGLDTSAGAIEVLRRRGVGQVYHGTVFQLDRTRPRPFDSVVLMGNNLGLLGGSATASRWLGLLDRLVAPGGRVLGSGLDPYRTDDPLHLAYHGSNRRRGRMGGQMRIRSRFKDAATSWFDYLFASPDELAGLLASSAWRIADSEERAWGYAVELLRR